MCAFGGAGSSRGDVPHTSTDRAREETTPTGNTDSYAEPPKRATLKLLSRSNSRESKLALFTRV